MANVAFKQPTAAQKANSVNTILWETLTTTDSAGTAYESAGVDRSVQVVGTFNSATLVLQGSNDGTNYVTLSDPLGNALSFTTAGLKQVAEFTRYIKPSHSGGGATTDLDVYVTEHGS